jgi:ABC-type uncharacterized transport system permease subunit
MSTTLFSVKIILLHRIVGDITHNLFPCYALAQALIQPTQVTQVIQTSLEMRQALVIVQISNFAPLSNVVEMENMLKYTETY